MNSLFSRDLCAALVLSFGHFLWIGILIATVAAVVVRRQRTAAARYRIWLAALVAMTVSPFVALAILQTMPAAAPVAVETKPIVAELSPAQRPEPDDGRAAPERLTKSPASVDETMPAGGLSRDTTLPREADAGALARTVSAPRESAWWRDYAPLVTGLYLIGVALMGLRLSLGLWGGRRLRRRATPITEASLLAALQRQATALGMRFVPALAYCERVTVPTVLGILKPMILLPVSLASGLAPDQIESVLAHELAHLRRYDHFVNLMQCVIESLLFFHPAIWWVSRRIRDEREHCCDDLVVACGAVPLDYAASLLRVAELSREAELHRGHNQRRSFTAVSLFATGDRPSTLRQRIARLLGYQTEMNVRAVHPWLLFCLATCCVGAVWVLTSMTWIVLAEINRDRSKSVMIVEWSVVVDEDVFEQIRKLSKEQPSGQPSPGEVGLLHVDAESLRRVVAAQMDDAGYFSFGQHVFWMKTLAPVWRHTGVAHIVSGNDFIKKGDEQYSSSWTSFANYFLEQQDGRAHLTIDFDLNGSVHDNTNPANRKPSPNAKQQKVPLFESSEFKGKLKIDELLGDGQAAVVVAPSNGLNSWKPNLVVVYEAIQVPSDHVDLFESLKKADDWLRRGPAGAKEHIARVAEWRARPARDPFAPNAAWTRELPNGGRVQLVGLGRPKEAQMIWWTPAGEPLGEAHPSFDQQLSDVELAAIVRIWETSGPRNQLVPISTSSAFGVTNVNDKFNGAAGTQLILVPAVHDKATGKASIRIGAGFGAWTAEATIGTERDSTATLSGLEIKTASTHEFKSIGKTSTAFRWKPTRDLEITAVAVTRNSTNVPSSSNPLVYANDPPNTINGAAFFEHKLAASDIQHVLIKSRPVHWTEFTDFAIEPAVALVPPLDFQQKQGDSNADEPGQQADVKTKVELLPDEKPPAGRGAPDPALDPTAGLSNPEDETKQTMVEPIDEEAVRLRAAGQALFPVADYKAMAAAYAELCDRTSATIDDHLWHGHAHQLARNWPAAVKAYHEALIKLDAQIAATEIELKTLEEKAKLDESIKFLKGSRYPFLKRDQEQLPKRWPDLVLLIGHLELVELKNPAVAAKTLSLGLRFAPELAVPLAELLANAEAAAKAKPDYIRGMQFIDPLETQRYLAMAQEQLNQPAAAFDTWSRVRLGKLVYPSSYATTVPVHLKELASKLPQNSLQPYHRFVLKTPDREPLKLREAKDFLKVGPANPFKATPLPGIELTNLGPSANSLVKLSDGRLLMAYASGDQHHIGIKLSSSRDGKEWDAPWEFAHNSVFDTRAPSLLVDDDGVIWMLCLSKRLTTERFASGPYELWLTHSRDGRDWSPLRSLQMQSASEPPRIATGQYQELAQLTRLPGRRFGIFHAGHFGSAMSLSLLTTLNPLSVPIGEQQNVNNPHATFDPDGRCHLMFDDFGRGLYYTRSNDLREWSPLQQLGVAEKNSSISRPQLLLANGRVALIHEKNSGTWLQRGTIVANGLQLGEATQVTDHLMPLNGSRLLQVGDQVIIPAGTQPIVSNLLSAPVTELLAAKHGPAETSPPDGLGFLKPYPKLHGLSLGMTEPQFLAIVKQQELKTRKTVEGEKVTHHIDLGDGHSVVVIFDKEGKCRGIQRVRGEDNSGDGRGANANGDLRSDPAAGLGGPRRAQPQIEKPTVWTPRRPDAVESKSKETAKILDDGSVQMSLPSPNSSNPQLKLQFKDETSIDSVRLEVLPDLRFADRRLGRIAGRELMLFEFKPHVLSADGKLRSLEWKECRSLQDAEDDTVVHLIDYATDTGWKVPPLKAGQTAHELVFQMKEPLVLKPGDALLVDVDSGGSESLDTLARFRVSFPNRILLQARSGTGLGNEKADAAKQSVEVRLVGGPKAELLPNVQVEFMTGYGSNRKSFGTFTTDEAGWLKASLPVEFYELDLKSEKEWPYLPFEKCWTGNRGGYTTPLSVFVTDKKADAGGSSRTRERSDRSLTTPAKGSSGRTLEVEKWLGGYRRARGFEPATNEHPARITFTLEPAVELVLRAVDIETGKGLAGAEFYEIDSGGENPAHPVYDENLGGKFPYDSTFGYDSQVETEPAYLTDNDGDLRRWVGERNSSTEFGVRKAPTGYKLVEPKAELSVLTELGQARAEQVFKFRRIRWAVRVEPEKKKVTLGEPLTLTFFVKNATNEPRGLELGGDYRNRLGRPESFEVTVINNAAKPMPVPDAGPTKGGISSNVLLKPDGETKVELKLSDWATITQPGNYRVFVKRTLKLFPIKAQQGNRIEWGDQPEIAKVAAACEFDVIAPAAAVIDANSEPNAEGKQSSPQPTTSPPAGLEFLKPYPKLHGLSLDMTEPQFLKIVKQQELKTRKTVEGEKVTHHIALGDDHTLIVMFDKDAKCSGIQRVRGEDSDRPAELPIPSRPKPRPDDKKSAEKPANSGVQAILPPLEFRFAAQPADSKFEPRVPPDYEKRDYSGNSVIGRMIARDKGFIWVGVAEPKDGIAALPVERLRGGQVREALLADTPEHALGWNGKWSIEDCRVAPDPNNADQFFIMLKLDEAGGAALRTLTKSHLKQPLAILVNNEIIAAPIVREEIGQNIAITGKFTRELADKLAAKIVVPPVRRDGQQQPAEPPIKTQAANRASPEEVFERRVSLSAKEMPLREALAKLARAAKVELLLDDEALKLARFDLEKPVTVAIDDEPLGEALLQLIPFDPQNGVIRTLRGGKLVLTTITAYVRHDRETTLSVLPEWLKPVYGKGLLVTLGDDNQIGTVTAGDGLTDELLAQLKTLPKLRELNIGGTTKITAAGLAHLAELTGLEKLTLSSVNESGEPLGDVALRHVAGLKSLRELGVNECGTTDAGIKSLEGMSQLRHLDIYQEGRLTDGAIASIAKLTGLKHLSLTSYVGTERWGFMRFSPEALRQLTVLGDLEVLTLPGQVAPDIVLAFPKLTSLDMGGPLVDDAVAEKVAGHRALKSLSLSGTRITDEGWKKIATLPELRRLTLRGERITDDGIAHLKTLSKLDHLELRTGSLTDASLGHLAEIKSLTRLDLWGGGSTFGGGGSHFTVVGLQQLKGLPKLRTLWLNNFEDAGSYGGLKELTQLRELVFEMANIRQQDFSDLETALPKTRISAGNGAGHLRSIRNSNGF